MQVRLVQVTALSLAPFVQAMYQLYLQLKKSVF